MYPPPAGVKSPFLEPLNIFWNFTAKFLILILGLQELEFSDKLYGAVLCFSLFSLFIFWF